MVQPHIPHISDRGEAAEIRKGLFNVRRLTPQCLARRWTAKWLADVLQDQSVRTLEKEWFERPLCISPEACRRRPNRCAFRFHAPTNLR